MQTRKLASSGPPKSYSLTYKGSGRPRLSKATRGGRGVGGGSPGSASEGLDPGKLAARAGSARPPASPGPAGRGYRGGQGREKARKRGAALGPRPARPARRAGQAGLRRRGAGVRGGDPSPAERGARDSHPPRQDGDVDRGGARRARLGAAGRWGGGGRRRDGRGEETKKKKKKASPRDRGGPGLLFLLVLAAGALHGESVPRGAFPAGGPRASLRPKRWLGPHAQRKGQVQRRGAKARRPLQPSPTRRRELQAVLAGGSGSGSSGARSSGSLVRAWPDTAGDGGEDGPSVPSDEEASVH